MMSVKRLRILSMRGWSPRFKINEKRALGEQFVLHGWHLLVAMLP